VPLIVLDAILIVTVVDLLGGVTLVTYRYLSNKFLVPLQQKLLEEGLEKGRQEGRQKGRQEGREEERRLWSDWNRRRVEAEEKGEPFLEPPPGS
jgi:hypothetical protein